MGEALAAAGVRHLTKCSGHDVRVKGGIIAVIATLGRIVAAGMAVLLVEQTTAAALTLAEYAYVLRTGRVALEGPAADLRHDPRVLDLYLGGEPAGDPPAARDR